MNRGKLILVTGGARSGKSTFAERYASDSGKQVIYLATAEVKDPEMQLRVEEHRRHRPRHFRLVEEPLHPERVMADGTTGTFYLLDCLTLLLNNHLLQRLEGEINTSPQKQAEISTVILNYMDGLAGQMQNCPADVLVVTNEVGLGVVPENFLGRLFRDLAGKTNQKVAARADEVWFAVCGIAKRFK
ncbi:MAG: bifunctional adenosylcobinamide kinase/adenosylcobinamide-phosphate guanylyltransferase [Dethiobacteria bacterium]